MGGRKIDADRLRGKTLATSIQRTNAKLIVNAALHMDFHLRTAMRQDAVVPIAVSLTAIEHIVSRPGRIFQLIAYGRPSQYNFIAAQGGADGFYWERLHHGLAFSLQMPSLTQQAFINGAGGMELEIGVVGEGHIAITLMREQLKNHRWHLRTARLGIILHPKFALRPFNMIERGKVGCDIVHHLSCISLRDLARESAAIDGMAVVVIIRSDGETSVDVAIAVATGISVQGKL